MTGELHDGFPVLLSRPFDELGEGVDIRMSEERRDGVHDDSCGGATSDHSSQ